MNDRIQHAEIESIRPLHVQWDGPFSLEEVSKLNESYDYGVYQVYGSHPIYGSDVMLYIGKAQDQAFGVRLNQEGWYYNPDAGNIRIYVGRLAGRKTPTDAEWGNEINLVETMLIYSHWPAGNSRNIQSLGKYADSIKNVCVLNWGNRRDLLSEVSGLNLTDRFYKIPNYHCYGDEDNKLDVE